MHCSYDLGTNHAPPCRSYDLGSKHCFKHFVTPKSFDAARRTCLRWKGHLATLTSPEENSFAVSAVNWQPGHMEDVWVGYSDAQGSQMEFEWLTGEVAVTGEQEKYENW